MAVGNGSSLFGRIVPLIFAQKVGVLNTLLTFLSSSGIMLFVWTMTRTAVSFLVYEAFYGVASGTSLIPAPVNILTGPSSLAFPVLRPSPLRPAWTTQTLSFAVHEIP